MLAGANGKAAGIFPSACNLSIRPTAAERGKLGRLRLGISLFSLLLDKHAGEICKELLREVVILVDRVLKTRVACIKAVVQLFRAC